MRYNVTIHRAIGSGILHTIEASTPEEAAQKAASQTKKDDLNIAFLADKIEFAPAEYSNSILGGKGGYVVPFTAYRDKGVPALVAGPTTKTGQVWLTVEEPSRGGIRSGAGRKPNAEKGLEPPGIVVGARIAPEEADWANAQVRTGRFPSVSAYIEWLVNGDRIHRMIE